MFDIGFSEMLVLAVVALVVLGPERLPKVARQAGAWMGKLRRYVDDVKSDINRQMELSELRDLKNQVTDAARDLETSVQSTVSGMKTDFDDVQKSLEGAAATAPQTDWDKIYATRRQREKIKDRRIEREKELGIKRPKRPLHR
ncbi:MAG: Sec-independent protein translocase protein TatB [Burkholderiaceae bacterium]|jgi:sec-independent protein translocase protein TatB|nr:twin-arginine translocase subunit TatB [Burkholderiales bacterium]MCZ8341186.1 Sec-independent protein translocase protein TatB [Burkholderiaceae bacterium]